MSRDNTLKNKRCVNNALLETQYYHDAVMNSNLIQFAESHNEII